MAPQPNDSPAPVPRLTFEHTALGSFVAEGDLWISTIPQGNASIELELAGNDSAPYEALTVAASALLAQFLEVKEKALAFLTAQEDAPNREDFICQGMELLREDYPSHFSLSFVLFGDDGGIWRVEFEDGEPLFLARDD